MERQRFEDSWKESFKDSEVSPSDNLWTNIELDLEKAEGKVMKKRVLYFKLLAAASVAFTMTFAGVGVYYISKIDSATQVAQNERIENSTTPNAPSTAEGNKATDAANPTNAPTDTRSSDNASNLATNDVTKGGADQKNSSNPGGDNGPAQDKSVSKEAITINRNAGGAKENGSSITRIPADKSNAVTGNESKAGNAQGETSVAILTAHDPGNEQPVTPDDLLLPLYGSLPTIARVNRVPVTITQAQSTADPVALMIARLNEEEKKYSEDSKQAKNKKDVNTERIWTSVGFAAGSFNTVSNSTSQLSSTTSSTGFSNYAMTNSIVQNQSSAAGKAYSVEVSVGGKVSDRWVLQGGVNYLTQSSAYTTNAVVGSADYATFKAASIAEINNAGKSDSRLVNTSSYNVNSNLQYLSVPLQAGYMIVNRGFGLQVNAGVSTDLFLQSTLTPDEGTLEKSTQGNGSDSPYRTVNFSGLVGTELSYRFSHRYRVSLNPGLRYPFSSIYKSDIAVSATPLTFDLGLRFRYIFN